ncbi:UNVERIFIED_CONTAM: hypothetical protein K2H54_042118 [Gekko kuhli]
MKTSSPAPCRPWRAGDWLAEDEAHSAVAATTIQAVCLGREWGNGSAAITEQRAEHVEEIGDDMRWRLQPAAAPRPGLAAAGLLAGQDLPECPSINKLKRNGEV